MPRMPDDMTRAQADRLARAHGLPDYLAWMDGIERQYERLPDWFNNSSYGRDRAYVAFVVASVEWIEEHGRILRERFAEPGATVFACFADPRTLGTLEWGVARGYCAKGESERWPGGDVYLLTDAGRAALGIEAARAAS